MKMTPYDILQKLGFDISEEGIFVSDDDAQLFNDFLTALGSAIRINNIPNDRLLRVNKNLSSRALYVSDNSVNDTNSDESLRILKESLEIVLKVNFKFDQNAEAV